MPFTAQPQKPQKIKIKYGTQEEDTERNINKVLEVASKIASENGIYNFNLMTNTGSEITNEEQLSKTLEDPTVLELTIVPVQKGA